MLDSTQVTLSSGSTVRTRDGLNSARNQWNDNNDINNQLAYIAKISYS